MRKLILCSIVGALSGCASVPAENPWDGLTTETKAAAAPLDCGKFPLPTESSDSTITYDVAGMNDLEDYRQCSEANEAIAGEHVLQIGQLKLARKGLTEAGQAQRRIADMKQIMLEDERRHHFWQSLGYWVLIAGAIAL